MVHTSPGVRTFCSLRESTSLANWKPGFDPFLYPCVICFVSFKKSSLSPRYSVYSRDQTPPLIFFGIIINVKHCVSCRGTAWWFDIFIHYRMITTYRLRSVSLTRVFQCYWLYSLCCALTMSPLKEVGMGLESVMQSEVGQRRTNVY